MRSLAASLVAVGTACLPSFEPYEPVGVLDCIEQSMCILPPDGECGPCPTVRITPPTPPNPPVGPDRPDFLPCPTHWRQRPSGYGFDICDPEVPESCPPGTMRLPGRCEPMGPDCTDEWPDIDLGPEIYVRASSGSGGSGTREDPFLRLSDALAVAGPGDYVLLGRGTHQTETVEVPENVWIWGACTAETHLVSSDEHALVGERFYLRRVTVTSAGAGVSATGFFNAVNAVFETGILLTGRRPVHLANVILGGRAPVIVADSASITGERVSFAPVGGASRLEPPKVDFGEGFIPLTLDDFAVTSTGSTLIISKGNVVLRNGAIAGQLSIRGSSAEASHLWVEQALYVDQAFQGSRINAGAIYGAFPSISWRSSVEIHDAFIRPPPGSASAIVGATRALMALHRVLGLGNVRITTCEGSEVLSLEDAELYGDFQWCGSAQVLRSRLNGSIEVSGEGSLHLEDVTIAGGSAQAGSIELRTVATGTAGAALEAQEIIVDNLESEGPLTLDSLSAELRFVEVGGLLEASGQYLGLTDVRLSDLDVAVDADVRFFDAQRASGGGVRLGQNGRAFLRDVMLSGDPYGLYAPGGAVLDTFDVVGHTGAAVYTDARDAELANGLIRDSFVGMSVPVEAPLEDLLQSVQFRNNTTNVNRR